MIPCAILGDSLAVGVAGFMPQCVAWVKSGINAKSYLSFDFIPDARVSVISLGSNQGPYTDVSLQDIRNRLSGEVIWLLPADSNRAIVTQIAAAHADHVIDVRTFGAGPGHIHPSAAGYRALAQEINKRIR